MTASLSMLLIDRTVFYCLTHMACPHYAIPILAISETCSLGQSPPLNSNKHRLGSAELALIDVNAQRLTALAHTLVETRSVRQVPALNKNKLPGRQVFYWPYLFSTPDLLSPYFPGPGNLRNAFH